MNKKEYCEALENMIETLEKNSAQEVDWYVCGLKYALGLCSNLEEIHKSTIILKNEPVKADIPDYVADFIEEFKREKYSLKDAIDYFHNIVFTDELDKYFEENFEEFVHAWIYGYTIINKQKYYVIGADGFTLLRKEKGVVKHTTGHLIENLNEEERKYFQLSKDDIMNYDKRYMSFAITIENF